ncbi:vancomycin resistance protein VanW [Salirhabdus euzebyi]|uniref:Vancomycin resistance protein VanW n=1 Tax=Salirhabdus euzebyi TaxID=394506 RepID=A0A841PYD4_9BACI|nr:VanW family protein [Salirhabdus euzebyi]MBB6452656.1 vancomycin resistance protein VanW [Salirhabdus euzebyi]
MNGQSLKPIKRSGLRIYLGTKYFRLKRILEWYFTRKKYATKMVDLPYRYPIAVHKTILRRKLKDVDMWYQENKIINLKIAIHKLNGIVIQPGETFSYWKLIGHPTRRKGYTSGMILHYGTFKPGIGGGLCQLSNLIYWITLHTSLTVTERHRHSYDVFPDANRTQPFGSGATCAYNYLDLQVKNNTNTPYQLWLNVTDNHLVGEWRTNIPEMMSYEIYQKDHKITHETWGGYVRHNTIYRKVFNGQNELLDDEYITENHALMMYNPLLSHTSYDDIENHQDYESNLNQLHRLLEDNIISEEEYQKKKEDLLNA